MEDFFLYALLGGVGVALAAGPIGCFLVWRRMAFFGAALAHSALLGVALGFLLSIDPDIGVLVTCAAVALLLLMLEGRRALPSDTLLALLAHSALALGLVVLALMPGLRVDLMGYLFGDVLAIGAGELVLIYAMAAVTLSVLAVIWRPLLSLTVHAPLAEVEGAPTTAVRVVFVLLVAAVIAIGMKIVGILLIVSLVIIPAAAARRLAATPETMAVCAAGLGALSVVAGLFGSLRWDVPAGPLIVVAATLAFGLAQLWPGAWRRSGPA